MQENLVCSSSAETKQSCWLIQLFLDTSLVSSITMYECYFKKNFRTEPISLKVDG